MSGADGPFCRSCGRRAQALELAGGRWVRVCLGCRRLEGRCLCDVVES